MSRTIMAYLLRAPQSLYETPRCVLKVCFDLSQGQENAKDTTNLIDKTLGKISNPKVRICRFFDLETSFSVKLSIYYFNLILVFKKKRIPKNMASFEKKNQGESNDQPTD